MCGRTSLLLLATLLAVVLMPSSAGAAPADLATTQSYLQADYRLVQTGAGRIPAGEAAIGRVLDEVSRECPQAAAGSPQDPESTQMSNEVIGAMVTSALHDDLPSIREYLRVAGRMRWSSHALTSAVQSYLSRLRTLAALARPNVCADVKSWAASGFRTLAAGTVAFDQKFLPSWVALGELPPSLSQYETGEGRALARRCAQREAQLSDFEAQKVETWGQIMDTLDLFP